MNSHFMQLLKLRRHDVPILDSSPQIQNELLYIMALTILHKITGSIAGRHFAIMVDETTDISNTEQLVFCLHYVDELNTHKNALDSNNSKEYYSYNYILL